jgi:hypothetical protein
MATLVDVGNLESMYEIYRILEGLGLAANGFYRSSDGTRECIFQLALGSSGKWIRIANVSGSYRPIFIQYGIGDNIQKTWTYQGRLGGNTDSYNNVFFTRIAIIANANCFGIRFFASNYNGFFFVGTMENGDTVSFLGGQNMGVTFLDRPSDGKGNIIFEQRPILKGGQVCYTPIPIVSSDYLYVSKLRGVDNACMYSPGSSLIELDGYNVVFFPDNQADTTSAYSSSAHAKWTGFRIL